MQHQSFKKTLFIQFFIIHIYVAISFHILILNFILALSDSKYNVILTIVDKFTKKITLISEKIT